MYKEALLTSSEMTVAAHVLSVCCSLVNSHIRVDLVCLLSQYNCLLILRKLPAPPQKSDILNLCSLIFAL